MMASDDVIFDPVSEFSPRLSCHFSFNMAASFISFLLLLCATLCLAKESKYSIKNVESPFRMNKYNILWDRAKKNLADSPKLVNLQQELGKLDKLSIKLKHLEDKGGDDDLSSKVKELFLDILQRYGLATNKAEVDDHHNSIRAKFTDKVEKLWQSALYSGKFEDDELDTLEKEFKHHEKKIEEYRQLANKITEHDTISENDIRSLDKPSNSELKKLRRDLKTKHHNISSGYLELSRKVKERVSDVTDDFTDSRVDELWHQAKKSEFSEKELESIKEELKHFQIRIDKHNYWKDRHSKMLKGLNDGDLMDVDTQEQISDKVKEHARLVKKFHATMMERVERKDEL